MNTLLFTAWIVRCLLLLCWMPFLILSEVVRLFRAIDKWSSGVIMDSKAVPQPRIAVRSAKVISMPFAMKANAH